jgi:hypothetical protein
MARDSLDPTDLSLSELGSRKSFLDDQIEALNEGARAKGGIGANKRDGQAREFSQKQVRVNNEIQDRLFDIHQDRSMLSQELDEQRKAPIADSPEQWAESPDQFDWPGIDTPR